ncbi:MAG: hypothetical protein ACRC1J_06640, partial [Sandaracinobacteroides sp.]
GISKAAADIIRQFEIGNCAFHPVAVFRKDRTTPVDGEWLCLNFGNVRQYFRPEDSPNTYEGYIRMGVRGWKPRFVPADGDLAVSAEAQSGPGIWIDSLVGDAFFLADPIARALKKAKADKGFFLARCRILET